MSKGLRNDLINVLRDDSILITYDKLMKMHNLLTLTEEQEEILKNFLININIPQKEVPTIVDTMLINYKIKEFYNYINNRTLLLNDVLDKKINIVDHFNTVGIDPNLTEWLMKLVWKTYPVSGEGEAALAILFKDARKPAKNEAGDMINGDELVEVKGTGARLIGQRGYGDGPSVALNIRLKLQQYADKYNIKVNLPESTLKYNFSKKDSWVLEDVAKQLIQESAGKITCYDIAEIVTDSLHLLYKEASSASIYDWVIDSINTVGVFDKDKFRHDFLVFSFNYYHSIEKFDKFVLINKNEVLVIKPEDFEKHIDNIKFGMPSFGEKAGAQGKAFAITLR